MRKGGNKVETTKATIETVLNNQVDLESAAKLQGQLGNVTNTLLVFDARNTEYLCAAFIGLLLQLGATNDICVKQSKETAKLFKMLGVQI